MRTVYLNRCLALMEPVKRNDWTTWLMRHGVDPMEVLIGHELICDDEQRRIYYTAIDRERPVINGQIQLIHQFVQLEAPALPFPA